MLGRPTSCRLVRTLFTAQNYISININCTNKTHLSTLCVNTRCLWVSDLDRGGDACGYERHKSDIKAKSGVKGIAIIGAIERDFFYIAHTSQSLLTIV